jgi:hypothetical protein
MNFKCIFTIACFFCAYNCHAQHYIAKDGRGELRIIDESRYEISFFSISGVPCDDPNDEPKTAFYDTGYYRVVMDTLFLSSEKQSWADIVTAYDTSGLERMDTARYLIQNLAVNGHGKWFEHYKYIVGDVFRKGDTIILYCPKFLCRDCIISVYDNIIQRRIIPNEKLFFSYGKEKSYYVIIYPDKVDRIYLTNFPLLVRGKELIPFNEHKKFECFVYNGFVFPQMDQRNRVIWKMGVLERGVKGQMVYEKELLEN